MNEEDKLFIIACSAMTLVSLQNPKLDNLQIAKAAILFAEETIRGFDELYPQSEKMKEMIRYAISLREPKGESLGDKIYRHAKAE